MGAYAPSTNFKRKDYMPQGDPDKAITGAELANEFANVSRAINSMVPGTYSPIVDYRAKDALIAGTVLKLVSGVELNVEFAAIATAITAIGYSTYTKTKDFAAADAAHGTVLGADLQIEFDAIRLAVKTAWVTGGGNTAGGWVAGLVSGGTVGFTAAALVGNERGFLVTGGHGTAPGAVAGGTLNSGSLAGGTDIGVITDNYSAVELSVQIRVLTSALRASPRTAYFTSVTIAGITTIRTVAAADLFNQNVVGLYTQLEWIWNPGSGITHMTVSNAYSAVFV